MSNELMDKAAEALHKLNAPLKQLGALAIEQAEKLSQLQVDSAKNYTGMTLEQLRAALQIEDAKGLQAFVEQQGKLAEAVAARLKADAEAVVEMQKQFAAAAQKLIQDQAKAAVKAAPRKSA